MSSSRAQPDSTAELDALLDGKLKIEPWDPQVIFWMFHVRRLSVWPADALEGFDAVRDPHAR